MRATRVGRAAVVAAAVVFLAALGLALARQSACIPRPVRVSGSPGDCTEWRLNLNTADSGRLSLLAGIGETLARAIVEDRARHGAFRDVSELVRVPGMGRGKIDRIRSYVTVGGN